MVQIPSSTLKYAPARKFAEGCHHHGELCEYGKVCQAIGTIAKNP